MQPKRPVANSDLRPDYELLKRNCTHFSDDFCRRQRKTLGTTLGSPPIARLGLQRLPRWIHNLAAAGVTVKGGDNSKMNCLVAAGFLMFSTYFLGFMFHSNQFVDHF